MNRRSLVIDTDTASDDAVALIQALRHPEVEVRALTVVAGNVPLDQAVRNAQVTLGLVGADVPVHPGMAKPQLREHESAQFVHGDDGMSGVPFPEPSRAPSDEHAVLALLRIAGDEPGRHELVTLGPLSNIAAALAIDPVLLTRFGHTWLMAGAVDGWGNVSATGEYNVWADPEAAAIVLRAPGEKTMIGWDVSRKYAVMTEEDDAKLRGAGPLGRIASDINQAVRDFSIEVSGIAGYDLPDPVAMAVALDETLITEAEWLRVEVSIDGPTRGLTFVDRNLTAAPPNVRVVTAVDESRFKRQLLDAVAGY